MKRSAIFHTLAGAFLAQALAVSAAVPRLIHFQGLLVDQGTGQPINGQRTLTFRIYGQDTGGSALWTEQHGEPNNPAAIVTVTDGFYNVLLGSLTPLDLDFDADYWLSVQVDTAAEMAPRHRLAASPYALNAERLGGQPASSYLNQTTRDYVASFTQSDLTNEVLTVNHNLGIDYPDVAIYDNIGQKREDFAVMRISENESRLNFLSSTNLLLHFSGADSIQTTTDSSASNHPVTFVGDAQIDTGQAKFAPSSLFLDGTGDYIRIPYSDDFEFRTGNFTIDFWTRFNSGASVVRYLLNFYESDANHWAIYWNGTATPKLGWFLGLGGVGDTQETTWVPSIGTWYHIAISRVGTSMKLFIDGTQVLAWTESRSISIGQGSLF